MTAPDSIRQLVEKFDRDKPSSETELRDWFVDPLFEALGWDLRAKQQVRKEPSVTVQEAGLERSKRADYSFHIGNTRHFFVETKMPHINLERNTVPAFQLRRYGWSGNTPVSVLTDFEEFCVYDCRIEPNQRDPAATARLRYWTTRNYIDDWAEIESRFSREAVAQGALREWTEGKRVRGALSVDQSFLREMENWRELLAADIALHNRNLSQRQLNLLVQRAIDRIVFLRIAEDRDIESYGRLRRAADEGRQVYAQLKILFREADDKYNSGLFHFGADDRASEPDSDSLNIHIPDEPLRHIIKNLYFPSSPYEFAVMPPEILGQVYEQFLGKVIELSPGGAVRIEAKPEVRKAGGVYYTPAYIVDYIVENTVGALLKDKTPAQAAKLRILDPACGSGSFLVGAYQYLLDWHLDYYSRQPDKNKNVLRRIVGGYALATAEKRRILQNNIYGVDLDQNAVEVSKLSLLLKMLENESDATGRQTLMFAAGGRILPDLSDNIKWGNSLIGSDFFRGPQAGLFVDEEAMLKVKAFDWDSDAGFGKIMAAGGFDAVIGNPPYVRMEEFKNIKPYLRAKYSVHADRMDLYGYFIEKEHELLRDDGYFGMIVSNKFIKARYGKGLRHFIANKANLTEIFDLAGLPVFAGATVRTVIILSTKGLDRDTVSYVPVMSVKDFESIGNSSAGLSVVRDELSYPIQYEQIAGDGWSFARPEVYRLLSKLRELNQTLVDHIAPLPVCMGVKSGLTDAFVIDDTTRQSLIERNPEAEEIIKPLLNGRDIRQYLINYNKKFLLYTYHGVQIERYPAIEQHLSQFRERLEKRATKQEWYELQQPQFRFSEYMDMPKIIFPDIGTTTRFALDTTDTMEQTPLIFFPSLTSTC